MTRTKDACNRFLQVHSYCVCCNISNQTRLLHISSQGWWQNLSLSVYKIPSIYIYIKSKHMTHVSWSIWELFLCNSTQFAHWKFLQKNYVGEEQGIEALDNCDPEPEHRLLYQVVNLDWGGGRVVGPSPTTCFLHHASWLKTSTYNKTGGNFRRGPIICYMILDGIFGMIC